MSANGKTIIEEFSQAKVTMMREVNRHPELVAFILEQYDFADEGDWGGILGEIAAYCNIGMEGDYYPAELDRIYTDIYLKLVYIRNKFERIIQ